jgi:hypothetical protein
MQLSLPPDTNELLHVSAHYVITLSLLVLCCCRIYYKDANHAMLPVTPQLIERFKAGLARCFKAALDAGALAAPCSGSSLFLFFHHRLGRL